MLPVIQSLWIGDDLSQLEKLCIKSFMDNGHEFHLYTYSDIGGIPEGTIIKDGNEILPQGEIFRTKRGGVATFSDWFRYALLAKKGDFWVDMDIVCIKPFDFDADILFPDYGAYKYISIYMLKCPKGHELMVAMEKSCRNHNEETPWDDAEDRKKKQKRRLWRKGKNTASSLGYGAGPVLFKAIKYFGLEKYRTSFMVFDPLCGVLLARVFDDSFSNGIDFYEQTHALHISNSAISKWQNFDKNAIFDKESLFEQLKEKHGIVPLSNAIRISSADVLQMAATQKNKGKKMAMRRRKIQRVVAVILVVVAFFICRLI